MYITIEKSKKFIETGKHKYSAILNKALTEIQIERHICVLLVRRRREDKGSAGKGGQTQKSETNPGGKQLFSGRSLKRHKQYEHNQRGLPSCRRQPSD